MKKLLLLLLVTLTLIVNAGCTQKPNQSPSTTNNTNVTEAPGGTAEPTQSVKTGNTEVTLYFPTEGNEAVKSEKRNITVTDGAIIKAVAEELLKGPTTNGLKNPFPEGTRLKSVNKQGSLAIVDFTKEFSGAIEMAEVVERVSVINSLASIKGVEKVRILVEGKIPIAPSGNPYPDSVKVALDNNGNPIPGEVKTIRLYFGNANADKVVAEDREVTVDKGASLESIVFEELYQGPESKDLTPVIPEETRLLSVEVKDKICYLNLSKEFVDNSVGGTASESMTINSIVNSLTELPEIQKVQFLIEGKIRETYTHVEFNEPFPRNEEMIQK